MSLIHRLIVGHFDIHTYVAHHPVPLQSLDVERTRKMLSETGEQSSDTEYVVDGESLYFADGYCDCPWLSTKHNTKSEAFARSVAQLENCLLIEKGAGTILHPVRSIQMTPQDVAKGEDDQMAHPLTFDEVVACRETNDLEPLCRCVVRAANGEAEWVEDFCVSLTSHDDFHVRGNALFALTMLASRERQLTRKVVQPLIEEALNDPHPYVSGHAHLAADTVEGALKWLIYSFDNDNPEIDVDTYSNGWIQCPNCNLRFATYDPWAFREGRCLRCRQRLRVHTRAS
jgi:hypothetical protein